MGRVIAVASGKGGVGKTAITANIAAALEKAGKKVLVFDADLNLRNIDLIFGVRDKVLFDISDIQFGKQIFENVAISIPKHSGITFIPAPITPPQNASETGAFLGDLAMECADKYDFVFIDLPAGVGDIFAHILRPGMKALIVATPDRTSVGDADRTADIIRSKGIRDVRLIVNRVRPELIKKRLAPDIDEIIDMTSVRLIGLVPEDPRIIEAGNSDTLLVDMKKSYSKKAFENISHRLCGEEVQLYKFWK